MLKNVALNLSEHPRASHSSQLAAGSFNAWKGIFFKQRKADGEPSEIAAGWCGCTTNAFVNILALNLF